MLVNIERKPLAERRADLESGRGAMADASIHFGWVRYGHQAWFEFQQARRRAAAKRREAEKKRRQPVQITPDLWRQIAANSLPEGEIRPSLFDSLLDRYGRF